MSDPMDTTATSSTRRSPAVSDQQHDEQHEQHDEQLHDEQLHDGGRTAAGARKWWSSDGPSVRQEVQDWLEAAAERDDLAARLAASEATRERAERERDGLMRLHAKTADAAWDTARAGLDQVNVERARADRAEAEVARLAAALPACANCGGAEGPPSHVYGERKCCPECDHRAVPSAEVARLREAVERVEALAANADSAEHTCDGDGMPCDPCWADDLRRALAAQPEAFGDLSDPEPDRDHRDDHDAWLRAQPEASICARCGAPVEHCDPTGDGLADFWSHVSHPADGHEAQPEAPCDHDHDYPCRTWGDDATCPACQGCARCHDAQPEAREEQDEVRCGARVPTPHPRISQQCVLPPAHDGEHSTRPEAPTAEEPRRG